MDLASRGPVVSQVSFNGMRYSSRGLSLLTWKPWRMTALSVCVDCYAALNCERIGWRDVDFILLGKQRWR